RVMRELLGSAPVKVLKIRSRDWVRRFQLGRLQCCFELDVEGKIIFRAKIRQWFGILSRQRLPKWLQGFQGHDPGRNAGAKVLGQKWTERLRFPCLNNTRDPLVD